MSPVSILFPSIASSRRLQDMSSRHLQDMSSRRLQHFFSVTIFRLPRRRANTSSKRLARCPQYVLKTSWKTRNCYAGDILKTCLEDVLEINKMFTRISVLIHGLLRNLNQYLTNLYFTYLRRI